MATALRTAFRERVTFRSVLGWLGVLALFRFGLRASVPQLVTTGVTMAAAGLMDIASDVYDLRTSVKHLGMAVPLLVSGAALLVFDAGTVWAPVVFLIIGGWFLLNAIQTVRHKGAIIPETTRDGHDVYQEYVARQIHGTLTEHPQTRRELTEALDADPQVIDTAIEHLQARNVIEEVGSELRVAEPSDRNWLGHAQKSMSAIVQHIARPIALEFEEETLNSTDLEGNNARREDEKSQDGSPRLGSTQSTSIRNSVGAETRSDRERN